MNRLHDMRAIAYRALRGMLMRIVSSLSTQPTPRLGVAAASRRSDITSSLIMMGLLRDKHEGLLRGNSDPNVA